MLRPRYTFVHFANEQFAGRDATLPKDWKPDADTLAKFQEFLKKNDIAYHHEEFAHETSNGFPTRSRSRCTAVLSTARAPIS